MTIAPNDAALFIAINTFCQMFPAVMWTGFSLLGNTWGVFAVTAPLLVRAPRLMMAWLCAAPFAIAFARIGKSQIESPRPAAVIDNTQFQIVGEALHNVSMPSGHTTTAFAVASGIYFALPVATRKRHVWLFGLAALVGLSRIAVGAHWPGDVIAGAVLGLLAGLLGQKLLVRIPPHHLEPRAWSQRLIATILVATTVILVSDTLDFDENHPLQYALAGVVAITVFAFLRKSWKPLQS
ncbi:MAG: hypothetical protein RIR79_2110 [Pseudomonadota bacterium]|jgi:membrane-associated phospholipid phosphatase